MISKLYLSAIQTVVCMYSYIAFYKDIFYCKQRVLVAQLYVSDVSLCLAVLVRVGRTLEGQWR